MTRSQATPASSQIVTLERMVEERDERIAALGAQVAKLTIDGGVERLFAYWQEAQQQRDALAAQVVAMRAAFDDIEGANSTDRLIIREAISLDTSAAEAILREREAKTLEEACARVAQEAIDAQTACDCLHALAAELRACQECGMIGTHKRQCSTGGQTQLVLPAEREGK